MPDNQDHQKPAPSKEERRKAPIADVLKFVRFAMNDPEIIALLKESMKFESGNVPDIDDRERERLMMLQLRHARRYALANGYPYYFESAFSSGIYLVEKHLTGEIASIDLLSAEQLRNLLRFDRWAIDFGPEAD